MSTAEMVANVEKHNVLILVVMLIHCVETPCMN